MLGNEKIIRELYAAAEGHGMDIEKFVSMFSEEGYMYERSFLTSSTTHCRSSMRRGRLSRLLARTPRRYVGRKRSHGMTVSSSWSPNTITRSRVC
jgi:hypothetical protein